MSSSSVVVNPATISTEITSMLTQLSDRVTKIRVLMGIKPDLATGTQQVCAAHSLWVEATTLVTHAQAIYGLQQPPDVHRRLNQFGLDLVALSDEIKYLNDVVRLRDFKLRSSAAPQFLLN
jgi:hypothetical protein